MTKLFAAALLALTLTTGSVQLKGANTVEVLHTESTNPVKNKASLGGGLLILLSLGVGYSLRKIHDFRRMNRENFE